MLLKKNVSIKKYNTKNKKKHWHKNKITIFSHQLEKLNNITIIILRELFLKLVTDSYLQTVITKTVKIILLILKPSKR